MIYLFYTYYGAAGLFFFIARNLYRQLIHFLGLNKKLLLQYHRRYINFDTYYYYEVIIIR